MSATEKHNLSFVTQNDLRIARVSTELNSLDRLGHCKARWGIGRMKYTVAPGIYAIGTPDGDSPVFVSANYKMSFDRLRSSLHGRNGWILVLDTKGINVWCAAGKGTFGTDELVSRIEAVGLSGIVNHRSLIVPQLGAPGVSAHNVKQRSGFKVIYGPVLAKDLPAFLDAGLKATDRMRQICFTLPDRTVLIPIEMVMAAKPAIITAVCFFILAGLNPRGYSTSLTVTDGLPSAALLLTGFLAAAILGPILLPWLPGRAFSLKGLWIGLAMSLLLAARSYTHPEFLTSRLNTIAWMVITPIVTSFVLMNFTGASTYTSLSGVRREIKIAVRWQVSCAIVGIGLWLTARFI